MTGQDVIGLAQLLRLASPALPIGAFAWSAGLEGAIDEGRVSDEAGLAAWVGGALRWGQARWEGPIVYRMRVEPARREALDALYLASRETRELRAETLMIGGALARLVEPTERRPRTLPWAWAVASEAWGIGAETALVGWFMSFVENQIAVAQKAMPLGQVAAQRVLGGLMGEIAAAHEVALSLPEDAWSSSLPGLAIASARHETQYSRLFRS